MEQEKLFIKNRVGLKIAILIDKVENQKGLAIIMHGLGSRKKAQVIENISLTFNEKNYTTLRFDATNSTNESEGNYEDATPTNYYNDLQDVMTWVKDQEFYQKPILAGHSLGGMCVALYAQKYQTQIKSLILIAPVVSGELILSAIPIANLLKWKNEGFIERKSSTISNIVRKLKWGYAEDMMSKSIIKHAENLIIPTLVIAGEKDFRTPPTHQTLLYWKLICPKEFHIISDADHDFDDNFSREKISYLIINWIEKLEE